MRPSLEYSSAVWDPHQQQDKQRLEMIQRRAARYVANRYHNTSSVSDMLDHLEWPSLESRRINSRLTMMHKMTKHLANVDTSDKLIPLQRPSRNCNTGIQHSIMQNIHTEGINLSKNHQGLECSKGRQCLGTES